MALPRFRLSERQGLGLILGASGLAFAAVLLLYRVSAVDAKRGREGRARVHWMSTDHRMMPGIVYRMADLMDPSLLALPSMHGFSKASWNLPEAARYRDPAWGVEPSYLEPSATSPDAPLVARMTLEELLRRGVAKAGPESDEPDENPVPSRVALNSMFQLDRALAERGVVRAPPLPVVASETALRPTQIGIAVDASGEVRFVMLNRSCGEGAIDARAQDWARQLRFEPAIGPDAPALTWGVVRLHWVWEPKHPAPSATAESAR